MRDRVLRGLRISRRAVTNNRKRKRRKTRDQNWMLLRWSDVMLSYCLSLLASPAFRISFFISFLFPFCIPFLIPPSSAFHLPFILFLHPFCIPFASPFPHITGTFCSQTIGILLLLLFFFSSNAAIFSFTTHI